MGVQHRHRKGALHQTNKAFKSTSGRRRSSISGKIAAASCTAVKPIISVESKAARLNKAKQLRDKKREELKERLGSSSANSSSSTLPPKLVVLVPLHRLADATRVKVSCAGKCDDKLSHSRFAGGARPGEPLSVQLPPSARMSNRGETKPRATFVDTYPYAEGCSTDPERVDQMMLEKTLDFAKAADVLLFILPPTCSVDQTPIDATGYAILSALRLQGIGTALGFIDEEIPTLGGCGLPFSHQQKMQKLAAARKLTGRFFTSELGPNAKWTADPSQLLALICGASPASLSWRNQRGFLLAEWVEIDAAKRCVIIEGYARGLGFNLRHGVHLTGIGDFKLARLTTLPDPMAKKRVGATTELGQLSFECEATPADLWNRFAPFDPFQGEQSVLTPEDFAQSAENRKRLISPDAFAETMSDNEEVEEVVGRAADAHDMEDDEDAVVDDVVDDADDEVDRFCDFGTQAAAGDKAKSRLELIQRERDDMEIEDEVDTPLNIPARERFRKYRALRSFRDTPWDPYEDLPAEYSRITDFERVTQVQKMAAATLRSDCSAVGCSGRYVRLELVTDSATLEAAACEERLKVLIDAFSTCSKGQPILPPNLPTIFPPLPPLLVSTLMPFERNVTVNHIQFTRRKDYTEILPAKRRVLIQCGFYRFEARPLFSTASVITTKNSQRLRYQRHFKPSCSSVVATIMSPVLFPPNSALMIVPDESPSSRMAAVAAWGTVLPPQPERLVLKRVALTGYPFRTHKKKAVVRYMFFNAQDINYFKPTEITTRKGLKGHITEPLGTHGYMKCYFNDFVDPADTVSGAVGRVTFSAGNYASLQAGVSVLARFELAWISELHGR